MERGDRRLSIWSPVALLALVMCSPVLAEELNYPREVTERLVGARPMKTQEVELVRDFEGGKLVSYRWLIHDWRRDRRGPGAYPNRTRCILFARAKQVEIVKQTADEVEVVCRFTGYDQESTIRVRVTRRNPNVAIAWMKIEGKGEIYEEFAAELSAVQDQADELVWEENRDANASEGPGRMLRWFLRSRPKGRRID